MNFKKPFFVIFMFFLCFAKSDIAFAANINFLDDNDKTELAEVVKKIYEVKTNCLTSENFFELAACYDKSSRNGTWAFEHEIKRVKYLNKWASERGIKFTKIDSLVKVKKITAKGTNHIRINLDEIYTFNYIYPKDTNITINTFGTKLRHTVSLVKKADLWKIESDWYTDCFEDALSNYTGSTEKIESKSDILNIPYISKSFDLNISERYDRMKAIEYADKYCGANIEGSIYTYNNKYRDFTGIGGDCTNFASQVLGDKDGGMLKTDGTWYCNYSKYGNSQGSSAWVNADGFKNYLIYSGKGMLLKKGTFLQLAVPQNNEINESIVQKLNLGDLVCYAKKSDMNHFAIITAWDSHGYPLVNSHTTDRYHVPWDLGWGDKDITFYLIHIR